MIKKIIKNNQYLTSISVIVLVSLFSYLFKEIIGYRTIALVLLMTVSILATQLSLYPVLLSAVLSAAIWDIFFIKPYFTIHVSNSEDALLLAMYFIIALINGVLTSRIKYFEKLASQREERANAIKLYDTLFNSVSHEFRTPIATIMGASENLLFEPKLNDKDQKSLYEEIQKASFRLNRLVDNLLNVTRLESGTIQPKNDWCDLNELFFGIEGRLKDELKNHKLVIVTPKNLPLLKLDAGLVEQSITNLIYNASIYTSESSTIELKGDLIKGNCIISVADNGKGFPKEEIGMVFQKFYRTKGSKSGGLGLGLSITKGFVESMKGTIRVENQRGSGAKFTIEIPTKATYGTDYSHELN